MADYSVRTDVYNGPLDLLLFLIRRDEIDIYDIPVARVTKQYLEYVETLQVIDPNVAGDFLVMAATLMEVKSRMLLPRQETADGDEDLADPRMELVRQLLEYKAFKDVSFTLSEAAKQQAAKWPRSPAKTKPPPPGEVDIDDAQIWDLVAAFNKMMSAIGAGPATHDIVFDDTPISLHAVDIVDQIQAAGGSLSFAAIFEGRTRAEMIGLFLALLELIRQQRIRIAQPALFGEIRIELLSTDPLEVTAEWESTFHDAVLGGAAGTDDTTTEAPPDASIETLRDPDPDATSDDRDADDGPEDDVPYLDLDSIKTDIDIDAIIKEDAGASPATDQEPNDP